MLSADGTEATRLGTEGQGPGELETPFEITWSRKEGLFVILDSGNNRVSLWDGDGSFVREKPLPVAGLTPRVHGQKLFMVRDAFGFTRDPAIIQTTIGKQKTKEILVFAQERRTEFTDAGNTENPLRVAFRWDPRLSYDLGSNFLVWTYGDAKRVHLIGLTGKPLDKPIEVSLPRTQITDDQFEEGINLMPADMQPRLRRALVKPESWPHIRDVFVDEADRIWVIGSSRDVKSSHPFRLFSRGGELIGRGYVFKVPNFVGHGALYYLEDKRDKLHVVKVVPRFDA